MFFDLHRSFLVGNILLNQMDDEESEAGHPLPLSATEVRCPRVQLHGTPLQTGGVSSGAWSAH